MFFFPQKASYKHLLESFRDWIRLVSDVSKFGAVLVNKQIVTLRDNDGKLEQELENASVNHTTEIWFQHTPWAVA